MVPAVDSYGRTLLDTATTSKERQLRRNRTICCVVNVPMKRQTVVCAVPHAEGASKTWASNDLQAEAGMDTEGRHPPRFVTTP